jgi:hypothetical protein
MKLFRSEPVIIMKVFYTSTSYFSQKFSSKFKGLFNVKKFSSKFKALLADETDPRVRLFFENFWTTQVININVNK